MFKIEDLAKQARRMQETLEAARKEVKTLHATGESGGGIVKVTLNGAYEAVDVALEASALTEQRDVLQDLIAAAVNDAVRRIKALQQETMESVVKKVDLPPHLKMFT